VDSDDSDSIRIRTIYPPSAEDQQHHRHDGAGMCTRCPEPFPCAAWWAIAKANLPATSSRLRPPAQGSWIPGATLAAVMILGVAIAAMVTGPSGPAYTSPIGPAAPATSAPAPGPTHTHGGGTTPRVHVTPTTPPAPGQLVPAAGNQPVAPQGPTSASSSTPPPTTGSPSPSPSRAGICLQLLLGVCVSLGVGLRLG
jgi:hypothetical protein